MKERLKSSDEAELQPKQSDKSVAETRKSIISLDPNISGLTEFCVIDGSTVIHGGGLRYPYKNLNK